MKYDYIIRSLDKKQHSAALFAVIECMLSVPMFSKTASFKINKGEAKGSLHVPLLFTLYTNNIITFKRLIYIYIDDKVLYAVGSFSTQDCNLTLTFLGHNLKSSCFPVASAYAKLTIP